MSEALNRSGHLIQTMPGLYELQGAKRPPVPGRLSASPNRYIVRVPDMKKYLEKHYGLGKLIYDANKRPTELVNLPRQTQGIIVFVWNGVFREFGASGHVDLFRLWPNADQPPRLEPVCAGSDSWAKMVLKHVQLLLLRRISNIPTASGGFREDVGLDAEQALARDHDGPARTPKTGDSAGR
jgi:hypothetical protein